MNKVLNMFWNGENGLHSKIKEDLSEKEGIIDTKKRELAMYINDELGDVVLAELTQDLDCYTKDFAKMAFYAGVAIGKKITKFALE